MSANTLEDPNEERVRVKSPAPVLVKEPEGNRTSTMRSTSFRGKQQWVCPSAWRPTSTEADGEKGAWSLSSHATR